MKKLLLLLLFVTFNTQLFSQISVWSQHYNIEEGDFKLISYSEKEKRGYLRIEKELREHFKINTGIKLFFYDNLIGDLNGDRINDFIILTEEGIFLFKISNGQYFEIRIDQFPDVYDKSFEGVVSLFFTNINNSKVEGIVEGMYYKERFDEWYHPISDIEFTLQELYQLVD